MKESRESKSECLRKFKNQKTKMPARTASRNNQQVRRNGGAGERGFELLSFEFP
jgi:hypothetical protein